MDTPSPPPLTPFRETVKYVSMDDMDEATRAFFAEHFFDFTGLETSGAASETLDKRFRTENADGLHDHEPQPRRFSTGMGLSRGRYCAICQDAQGRSGQTLAMELWNYANPKRPVAIGVRDLLDEVNADTQEHLEPEMAERARAGGWTYLHIAVHRLGEARPEQKLIPYRLRTIERTRVFDLRTKAAIDWMYTTLNSDWPNLAFLHAVDRSSVDYDQIEELTGGEPRLIGITVPDLTPETKVGVMSGLAQTLAGQPLVLSGGLKGGPDELRTYADLFRFLLTPENGGSVLLTAFASYLRATGVEAVAFPSARDDCGVFEGRAYGFNLVDYRELPVARPAIMITEEPGFFGRRWPRRLLEMHTANPEDVSAGATWGWRVRGHRANTIGRHKWWVMKSYLAGTSEEYQIPRLLIAKDGDARSAREFTSVRDVLCGIYDGTVLLDDRAWGFFWALEFGTPTLSVGDWLAAFASRNALFGREAAPTRFDGRRSLVRLLHGAEAEMCVCCGQPATAEASSATVTGCQSCGFRNALKPACDREDAGV